MPPTFPQRLGNCRDTCSSHLEKDTLYTVLSFPIVEICCKYPDGRVLAPPPSQPSLLGLEAVSAACFGGGPSTALHASLQDGSCLFPLYFSLLFITIVSKVLF